MGTKDKPITKVSPFEYSISVYINENINPVDMNSIKPKSRVEVMEERKSNLVHQASRIKVQYK